MQRIIPLLAALVTLCYLATPASAHRPRNCSKLEPRHELRCAHMQHRSARNHLAHPNRAPSHSPGYWRWRVKVTHRWIVAARYRLEQELRFTPNYGAARFWTHRYFGYGWEQSLMMCIARRESHYTLGATHQNYPTSYGVDHGPFQVNDVSHPWVNFYRIVRSWKYATAVAYRISGNGTDFSAWGGRC